MHALQVCTLSNGTVFFQILREHYFLNPATRRRAAMVLGWAQRCSGAHKLPLYLLGCAWTIVHRGPLLLTPLAPHVDDES